MLLLSCELSPKPVLPTEALAKVSPNFILSAVALSAKVGPKCAKTLDTLEPLDSYKTYSDEQLFQLLKADDQVAFAEIYHRYWDKLYVFALTKSNGNNVFAQEIVQDVFIDLWTKRSSIDLKYSLYTYIASMARYRLLKVFARAKKEAQQKNELYSTLPTTVAVDFLSDIRDMQERIRTTIGALPDRTRLVFQMSRDEELSYKEIASELGVTQKAVEGHISLALKRLRAAIGTLSFLFSIFF